MANKTLCAFAAQAKAEIEAADKARFRAIVPR